MAELDLEHLAKKYAWVPYNNSGPVKTYCEKHKCRDRCGTGQHWKAERR